MAHRTSTTAKRRPTVTAMTLAVLLASSLLSGCSLIGRTTANGSSAGPTQSTQTLDQLAAAYAKLGTESIQISYEISRDSTKPWFIYASYDAETNNVRVHTMGLHPDVEFRLISSDFYVNWPGLSKRPWMHLKRDKLPNGSATRQVLAVFAFARPLAGAESAINDDTGGMNGFLNLSKAAASVSDRGEQLILDDLIQRAGDAATKVKFWAALSNQGQLLNLMYTVGQGHDYQRLFVTFGDSDQGPDPVTKPDPTTIEEATPAAIAKL